MKKITIAVILLSFLSVISACRKKTDHFEDEIASSSSSQKDSQCLEEASAKLLQLASDQQTIASSMAAPNLSVTEWELAIAPTKTSDFMVPYIKIASKAEAFDYYVFSICKDAACQNVRQRFDLKTLFMLPYFIDLAGKEIYGAVQGCTDNPKTLQSTCSRMVTKKVMWPVKATQKTELVKQYNELIATNAHLQDLGLQIWRESCSTVNAHPAANTSYEKLLLQTATNFCNLPSTIVSMLVSRELQMLTDNLKEQKTEKTQTGLNLASCSKQSLSLLESANTEAKYDTRVKEHESDQFFNSPVTSYIAMGGGALFIIGMGAYSYGSTYAKEGRAAAQKSLGGLAAFVFAWQVGSGIGEEIGGELGKIIGGVAVARGAETFVDNAIDNQDKAYREDLIKKVTRDLSIDEKFKALPIDEQDRKIVEEALNRQKNWGNKIATAGKVAIAVGVLGVLGAIMYNAKSSSLTLTESIHPYAEKLKNWNNEATQLLNERKEQYQQLQSSI